MTVSAFDMQRLFEIFHDLSVQVYNKMERTVPGFRKVMENVEIDSAARETKREQKRAAQKRAEEEIALFGRVRSDDE